MEKIKLFHKLPIQAVLQMKIFKNILKKAGTGIIFLVHSWCTRNINNMNMETSNKTMEIAQTIMDQIKYADRSALMAWGATNFAAISESKEFQGGLTFQVNGLTHKGWVKVCLRWVDDYTIVFINKNREVVKTVEGCYCDMLVSVIDFIEGK